MFADRRGTGSALGATWDLTFTPSEPELSHLPRDWMYRRTPVPRTKLVAPFPDSTRARIGARSRADESVQPQGAAASTPVSNSAA